MSRPSADGFAPLYVQIAQQLRGVASQLNPGDLMPSEAEIMALTGVGRVTVRRAMADLAREGLIVGVRGKGTFVAQPRVPTPLGRPIGFSESMRRRGRSPASHLLRAFEVAATEDIARHLKLQPGAPVAVIERLRLIDGTPAMVEVTHLSAAAVPGLLQRPLEGSLYECLQADYGLVPNKGSEVVLAISAGRDMARHLSVSPGAPLLATYRTTETATGQPLEFTLRYARGDLCSFEVALNEDSDLVDQASEGPGLLIGQAM